MSSFKINTTKAVTTLNLRFPNEEENFLNALEETKNEVASGDTSWKTIENITEDEALDIRQDVYALNKAENDGKLTIKSRIRQDSRGGFTFSFRELTSEEMAKRDKDKDKAKAKTESQQKS